MTPVLFELPLPGGVTLPIPVYGVFLALGFLLATTLAAGRARGLGVEPLKLFDSGFLAVVSGLFGAHLLDRVVVALGPRVSWGGPGSPTLEASASLLRPWEGGLAYYGGLAGGAVVLIVAARRNGVAPLALLDLVAPVSALALGVTRVGCFLNGCCFGRPSALPWAVSYPPGSPAQLQHAALGWVGVGQASLPVHPSQLYEAVAGLVLFALLWARYRRRRFVGEIVYSFLAAYAVWRFASQFLRADGVVRAPGAWLPLDPHQLLSVGVLLVALVGLWARGRRAENGPALAARRSPLAPGSR